jgi:hypothetical protein
MNQPWSKCASWMHDLIKISDSINLPQNGHESSQLRHSSPSETSANNNFDMDVVEPTDNSERRSSISTTPTDATQMYTENFPGAGSTYGTGQTFMNIFDTDQYAHFRTHNLYYPFASKAEWELASFLLSSNLSMQAIDEFLLLELVSHFMFYVLSL